MQYAAVSATENHKSLDRWKGAVHTSGHFVRLNERAWSVLKRVAVPLDDSVSDAVIRLAFLAGVSIEPPGIEKPLAYERQGRVTPHRDFREPILAELRAAEGTLDVPTLKCVLRRDLAERLTPADRRVLRDGDERWWHAAQTERLHMIRDGLLKRDGRRGWWQLTDSSNRVSGEVATNGPPSGCSADDARYPK